MSVTDIERFVEAEGRAEKVKDMLANVDIKVAEGRILEKGDKWVAFIGWNVHKNFFDKELPLKGNMLINEHKFRVVGIKEEQGSRSEAPPLRLPGDLRRR